MITRFCVCAFADRKRNVGLHEADVAYTTNSIRGAQCEFPRMQSPKNTFIDTDGRFKSILLAPRSPWLVVDHLSHPRTSTLSEVTNTTTLASPTACTWSPQRQPTLLSAPVSGAVKFRIWWTGLKPLDDVSWIISLCLWNFRIYMSR